VRYNTVTAGPGGGAAGGPGGNNGYPANGSAPGGTAGTPGHAGTAEEPNIAGATAAGTFFTAAEGATVTNVLEGFPTGWVLLATFSGGPTESSASAYQAFVARGDGSSDYSVAVHPNVMVVLAGGNIEVIGTHAYAPSGVQSATVALWIPGNVSSQAQATIDVATDVASQVQIKKAMPTATSATITVTNRRTGGTIDGSLNLLLSKLPYAVTIADASVTVGGTTYTGLPIDLTSTGVPYIHIPTTDLASLAPGASIVLHVDFNDPLNTPITFGTKWFSDPFDS
jgi:hypothetical protein